MIHQIPVLDHRLDPAQLAVLRTALDETEAALARMDSGRYGRCGRCGSMISLERLSAYPQARHCARCQLLAEMQR